MAELKTMNDAHLEVMNSMKELLKLEIEKARIEKCDLIYL
jgi:hypothetical protein